jgi:nitroreductase
MQSITDVQTLFRYQRAIRTFTEEAVPDELVNQVLTAAIHGPSGSNTQPWHFIVVRDPTVKHAISEVYEEARASGRAGFQTGASIYPSVQNLLLAARALGLGSCLTTLHRRRKARIHEILGIPDHIESAAIIPLGWPDRDYGPNRRPPLAQFVMYDRWTGPTAGPPGAHRPDEGASGGAAHRDLGPCPRASDRPRCVHPSSGRSEPRSHTCHRYSAHLLDHA